MSYKDKEKKRESERKSYHKNLEKSRERKRMNYKKNKENYREKDNESHRIRYHENLEEERKRSQEYAKKNPEIKRKNIDKDRLKNPERWKARKLAKQIPLKESCEICHSKNKLERHHWRYDKPLLVATLCKDCHTAQHFPIPQRSLIN